MAELQTFIAAVDEIVKFTHCLKDVDNSKLNREAWEAERNELNETWADYKKAYKNYLTVASTLTADEQKSAQSKHISAHKTYLSCVAYIAEKRNTCKDSQVLPKSEVPKESNAITVRPCSIPTFYGSYNTWPSFRDMFTALYLNNTKLSGVEKFYHLLEATEGDAKAVNINVPFTDEGFAIAWENLRKRYENKKILVFNQLRTLFTLPHCEQESAFCIKRLQMGINNCMAVLRLYKFDIASWDPIFVFICTTRLPRLSLALWEQTNINKTEVPQWEALDSFLTERYQTLESYSDMVASSDSRNSTVNNTSFKQKFTNQNKSHTKVNRTKSDGKKCGLCDVDHALWTCSTFLNMDFKGRLAAVRRYRHCVNCLDTGHMVADCKSQNNCFKCQLKHHTLLHREYTYQNIAASDMPQINKQAYISQANPMQYTENIDDPPASVQIETVKNYHISVSHKTMLATAWINISHNGVLYKARALIDPCSDETFVSERIQKTLKLPTEPISVDISGLGAGVVAKSRKLSHFSIFSILNPHLSVEIDALVVTDVTGNVPTQTFEPREENELPKLDYADPEFYRSGPVDILLGGNVYPAILKNGVRHGIFGSLVAQETIFGWIVTGPVPCSTNRTISVSHCTRVSLDDRLSKFWEIEEVSRKPIVSEEHKICEEIYNSTTKRNADGRYVVNLPFKHTPVVKTIGPNRHIALRQFLRNEKALVRKPEYKKLYDSVINEYLTLGHMEKVQVPQGSVNASHFYLPHHGVFKPESTTTKLRVVFNASSTSLNGNSLNDVLYVGPTLQSDIITLILKWRFFQIVFNADITKMYRQILVNPNHATFQRILFRSSPGEEVQDFQLKTVTFGVNCAPYLAIRTLHQLANDEEQRFPIGSKILRESMYVDDALVGAHSVSEALEAKRQLIQILESAGFQLRKWTSNTKQILADLPRDFLLNEEFLNIDDKSTAKTLGVRWNASNDSFYFVTETIQLKTSYTKREVLSIIAKLFDPAGWLSPIIINAKILMQQMWLDKIEWDENIKPIALQKWLNFLNNYSDIDSISIPRWVRYSPSCNIELHGFCDASELAYAATLYVRVEIENQIFTHLLVAKTRVAPIKKVSLPRLELCGALLLANLMDSVLPQFQLKSYSSFLWSDSTIVLSWLKKTPNCWTTFVANRVATIQEKVGQNWAHVDTHSNPADLATRGITPSELKENNTWWHGPEWLGSNRTEWPSHTQTFDTTIEMRKVQVHMARSTEKTDLLDRFSCLSRAIHVIAYIFRFFKRTHPSSKTRFESFRLSAEELSMVRNRLFRLSQEIYFPNEYNRLSQKKPLDSQSRILTLTPFLDKNNIIRANGRLSSTTSLPYHERFPIILAYDSKLARLYVDFIHKMLLHGGSQLMLATIRAECWIIKAKNLIKTQLHNCKECVLQRKRFQGQLMAALPGERTTLGRPFTNTGIDYAGPFDIKSFAGRGCRVTKGYICLFICFATKAIHLEAVSDLSTPAFLAAFSRFVSRRGCPSRIYSDNGKNFLGASNELKLKFAQHTAELQDMTVSKYGHQHLSWHFIPASAPHMGGLWEAGVKSCKTHLKKIAGQSKHTFEEFCTMLSAIEACLNSRPLTPLSENVEDLCALTPGHFLIGSALLTPAEPEEFPSTTSMLNRWRRVKVLQQEFCRRWKSEYLKELHKRNKWKRPQEDVKVDDLVVIRHEPICPTEWRLGRVIKVYYGSDNRVRVADLRTQNGIITRPIHKLVLLPQNDL